MDDCLTKIALNRSTPVNLDYTFNCGQVFRWEKKNDFWYGIVGDKIIKIKKTYDGLLFQIYPEYNGIIFIKKYLRLNDDLSLITSKIAKDITIKRALDELYGLRIIRQDPWECLISYICATFTNISRIKKMIMNLSQKFGSKIIYDGYIFYSFPTLEKLVKADLKDLLECKLGFRAKYVKEASRIINEYKFDLKNMDRLPYREAKDQLLIIPGIGLKVADCILLFSLNKLEAFPVDVWIKRIITKYYPQYFNNIEALKTRELTSRHYEQINNFGRQYFGEYAGYAQEYLFQYYRSHHN